jgi:hypothetical protein
MNAVLEDVIAERAIDADGVTGAVQVRIGRPVADPEGDWSCPIQVTGIGSDAPLSVAGVDSLQALTLALDMLRARLSAAGREKQLRWLDGTDLEM